MILQITLLLLSVSAPKYPAKLSLLRSDHEFVRQELAPDYWSLAPFYWPQLTDASCSSTAATVVLNAILTKVPLQSDDELLTPNSLLKKVNVKEWTKQTQNGGDGVPLKVFGEYLKTGLKVLKLSSWKIEVVEMPPDRPNLKADFLKVLQQNEANPDDYLIANFLQGELTEDPDGMIGHYSPIAAFDEKKMRVLILDVDRQWYEPYWAPFEDVFKSMASIDKDYKSPRGYIRLSRSAL